MITIVFFVISMLVASATLYCEYKIEEYTFTDKKLTKYWVGLGIGSIAEMCVVSIWNFVEFGTR